MSGEHLSRCLVYIDTNMVRAEVVRHLSECSFSGYNAIQEPRKKNVLIDYQRLQGLLGYDSYDQLRKNHKGWVEAHLAGDARGRQDVWTDSIAVGSRYFIESVKTRLGFRAKGRKILESVEGYQLREIPAAPDMALLGAEKGDIGLENDRFWNIKNE